MAYTFLKAEGFTVGKSLVENDMLSSALEIKKRAAEHGVELLLPTDHQVVDSYEPIKGQQILAKTIPSNLQMRAMSAWILASRQWPTSLNALTTPGTIIWNGPMGVFEEPPFDQGTNRHCPRCSRSG